MSKRIIGELKLQVTYVGEDAKKDVIRDILEAVVTLAEGRGLTGDFNLEVDDVTHEIFVWEGAKGDG